MTASQFTEEFVKTLTLASPTTKVLVKKDLELQLINSAGKDSSAFLYNAYDQYLQNPESVKDVIQRYTASYLEPRDDEAQLDRTRIVPIIKDRQWLSEIAQSLKNRGMDKPVANVFEELNEQLVIVYAEDSPTNIRYLSPEGLEELGVSKKELRAIAISNLKKIVPKIEIQKGPVLSMVTAGGDYEASLLLFDDLWTDEAFQVDGEVVVAIPARDLLLVTGSKTPGGIAKLREIATKSLQQSSYRLTDTLFVYRDGKFMKFEAP
jgi:uncharacterized protein YtpQ (UPF0354 family)